MGIPTVQWSDIEIRTCNFILKICLITLEKVNLTKEMKTGRKETTQLAS